MMKRDTNPFDRDREFTVILENIHTQIGTLAEGQNALRDKVDLLYLEFGRQKEELFVIKTDVRFLKEDVSTLKEDVSLLKEDVSLIKEDMSLVKADVSILKDDVRVIKIDLGEIKGIAKSHDNRLSRLEVSLT